MGQRGRLRGFDREWAAQGLLGRCLSSGDIDGTKAVSVGLDAEYRNTYTASLSYTDFFGGDYNTLADRDFLALSFGVNF